MGYQADATDRKIIALLLGNGRMPVLEIARQIGVVEGTVRKRLERLLSERVLRVLTAVDYEALGYGTHVLFQIQAELGRVDEIGRQLASRPEVVAVWQSTGASDLTVEAVFASDRELVAFLQDELASIGGVGRVETLHLVRPLKRSGQWRLPQAIPARPSEPARRVSILVIDDDPAFFAAARAALEPAGYRVTGSRDGQEGLAAMRQSRPDLVILDVMLAYLLDGLQVSRAMAEDESLQNVPILMVSARPTAEMAGLFPTDEPLLASDFLTKPVTPTVLLARVDRELADTMVNRSA